jgi:HSP20 family protein
MAEHAHVQNLPVKMYRTAELLSVAAPMPGLAAADINVAVTADDRLVIEGALRGVLTDEKEVLLEEWHVGPYRRALSLPVPVDGSAATVTYGNGVLVVALPVAAVTRPAELTLEPVVPSRGVRLGRPDQVVHPLKCDDG